MASPATVNSNPGFVAYRIQSGDTLNQIAKRAGFDGYGELLVADPHNQRYADAPGNIRMGDVIMVPASHAEAFGVSLQAPTAGGTSAQTPSSVTTQARSYTVRSGDTLENIGSRNRTPWRRIWVASGRPSTTGLRIGQKLTIPQRSPWTPLMLELDPGAAPRPEWSRATAPEFVATRTSNPAAELLVQINAAADLYGLPRELVRAVVATESNFERNASSDQGAVGLMQLMPPTAYEFGSTDRKNPRQNLSAGCALLVDLLNYYEGNLSLALAAYNAGTPLIDRLGRVPYNGEPAVYVRRVMTMYQHYLGANIS